MLFRSKEPLSDQQLAMSEDATPTDFTKNPDAHSAIDKKTTTTSQIEVEKGSQHNGYVQDTSHGLASLGQGRKNLLLLIFSVATFVDVCK